MKTFLKYKTSDGCLYTVLTLWSAINYSRIANFGTKKNYNNYSYFVEKPYLSTIINKESYLEKNYHDKYLYFTVLSKNVGGRAIPSNYFVS